MHAMIKATFGPPDRSKRKTKKISRVISPDDGRRYQVTHSLGEPPGAQPPNWCSRCAESLPTLTPDRTCFRARSTAAPRARFTPKPIAEAARPGSKAARISAVIRNLPCKPGLQTCNAAVSLPTTGLRHHVPTVPTPENHHASFRLRRIARLRNVRHRRRRS